MQKGARAIEGSKNRGRIEKEIEEGLLGKPGKSDRAPGLFCEIGACRNRDFMV